MGEGVNGAGRYFWRSAVNLKKQIHPFFQQLRNTNMPILNALSAATCHKSASSLMLVVEDNPMAQRMILRFVNSLGFQVDIASNGTEAVALFEPGKIRHRVDGHCATRSR